MNRFSIALIGAAVVLLLSMSQSRAAQANVQYAYFAGGCFWCMEADFEKLKGVGDVVSGYMGGHTPDPTYARVSAGGTGYAESVKVPYDPDQLSYQELLTYYWHHVDPLTANAQFCDHGSQYRTAIFVQTPAQKKLAEASRARVAEQLGGKIQTQIVTADKFYPAETYHQNYYKKNPVRYHFYRYNCGRDARVQQIWGPVLDPH